MVYTSGGGLRFFVQAASVCVIGLSVIPTAQPLASNVDSGSGSVVEELVGDCEISDGDKAFGIQGVIDIACATGGLGCYNDHCRYCKVIDTLKSAHLESCESLGASFPSMAPLTVSTEACHVSSGDAAVGVGGMTDPSCLYGGIGCFNDHCRFCQSKPTPQSSHFLLCSWVENSSRSAESLEAAKQSCSETVSDGDAAVGIKIVTDSSCSSGGLGCIDQICRFCRVTTTAQSASFVDCATIAGTPTTAAPATTPAPTKTPALTTVAPTKMPAPTSAPSTTICTIIAAAGDVDAGINIVTDTTCASGGLGCIDNVCRFCRVSSSTQSSGYVDCAAITGTTTQTLPTSAPTPAPTPSTKVASPAIVFECSRTISSGDKAVGLDIASDIRCSEGGTGCLDEVCRFCKRFDTVQSQSYVDCSTIPSSDIGFDISFVPIPVVDSDAPTRMLAADSPSSLDASSRPDASDSSYEGSAASVCTMAVSSGDAAVGINIVTDTSCSSGGTGCIDTICRYCKTKDTDQSAHLSSCPSTTAAPLTTTKTCMTSVSDGDASVGINIITDTSCAIGGLGCIDSICRYCKTKSTDQSTHFGSCSDYSSTTSSPATSALPVQHHQPPSLLR
ncbi:Apoptosis-inducing factor B [Phytophthora nicotianae]|uniref:Apoptosis-inducing factor B n=1 Tax=Phytophthora nicotianae TaxID=4792 RepID=A0A0W8DM54_PHYNI|nr:Apoptosis-inducing factor B [Phytophthora nicotianae]